MNRAVVLVFPALWSFSVASQTLVPGDVRSGANTAPLSGEQRDRSSPSKGAAGPELLALADPVEGSTHNALAPAPGVARPDAAKTVATAAVPTQGPGRTIEILIGLAVALFIATRRLG